MLKEGYNVHLPIINPLGPWTGGINVDCGCTNRKLGSDMGDGVSGGGINGKDLSKGDVSINIVAFLKAVQSGQTVTACCSIGDEQVTFQYANGRRETETFADIVEMARLYILTDCNGSFETFSEWGLIRPKS
jgi:S-adenosylmethionine synthetase